MMAHHATRSGLLAPTRSRQACAACGLLVLLAGASGCLKPEEATKWKEAAVDAPREAAAVEPLRYRFAAGEQFTYQLTIEADLGSITQKLQGHLHYRVKSPGPYEIELEQKPRLLPKVERRTIGSDSLPHVTPPPNAAFAPLFATVSITIDESGNVLDARGGPDLPYFLGNLATLTFLSLAEGEQAWTGQREVTGPRFGDRGLAPTPLDFADPHRPLEARPSYISATEQIEYRLADRAKSAADEPGVRIEVRSKMHSQDGDDAALEIVKTGEGYVIFDPDAHLPVKGRISYLLTLSASNLSVKVPLKVSYDRLDKEASEKWQKQEHEAQAETAYLTEQFDVPHTRTLLEELKTPEKRPRVLRRLARNAPNELQYDVSQALVALLSDEDRMVRVLALSALSTWGTAENTSDVMPLLESDHSTVRKSAIKTLGALGDARAAPALARFLEPLTDCSWAVTALQSLGPAAEDYVLPYLDSDDELVRTAACHVLEQAGSKKSLPKLQAIVDRDKGFDVLSAKRAIDKINSRP